MDELITKASVLQDDVAVAVERLRLAALQRQLAELKSDSEKPDFWADNLQAQAVMKQIADLEARTAPWLEIQTQIKDLLELANLKDVSMQGELAEQLAALDLKFDRLKEGLKLTGPYDDHAAILSIYAGAGGTDAQDWAQMMLRMYVRFAEQNNYKVVTVDESPGEEAGIKSVTLEVDGPFAYGKLKSEHGVHRLVRLSPFNADHLRQTSFAKVEIAPKIDEPKDLELDDKDLKIDVYRSGGHGGQSVNTTDSAVRVTHLPTGVSVAIQNERSQLQNKETALTILRSRLAQMQLEQHQEKLSELKGPNQAAEWGNQIRNYVLHPYKQVKDLRTGHESSDPDTVLSGSLAPFIDAYLEQNP